MSEKITVHPDDEYNRILVSHAHPPEWVNPEPAPKYNLVVLGAGTAGLVVAAGAAGLGARVALVEKHLMGGDCLNFGCVPSKAVIRSSRAAGEIARGIGYGVKIKGAAEADFSLVMERLRRLRAKISEHDSVARFESLGVDVFLGEARFVDRHRVEVDGKILKFKKAAVTTGARPAHPPIEGLQEAGFLTNETIFSLTRKPGKLAVLGGGPVGCELAQAFGRLGSQVTIIQKDSQFLPREDRDAADVLGRVFEREGIRCLLNSAVKKVSLSDGRKVLYLAAGEKEEMIETDEILVGVGRVPNVENLNLESAGVEFDTREGIKVNKFLQTTNPDIYAAGDVCFPYKFTHIADATARIVIQNALFLKSKKTNSLVIPWCTYTDPEIAHVGMYEKDARSRGIPVETYIRGFKDVDRAILDGEDEGFVKLLLKKGSSRILGATIVASHAGEMIGEITLAMVAGKGVKTLSTSVIHPYPTQAEAIRQAASQYYANRMTPFLEGVLRRWFAWKR